MRYGEVIDLIDKIDRGAFHRLEGSDFQYLLEKNRRKFLPLMREWLKPFGPSREFMEIAKQIEVLRHKYTLKEYEPDPDVITPIDPKNQEKFDAEVTKLRAANQELFAEQDEKDRRYQEFRLKEFSEKLILIPLRTVPKLINGYQIRALFPLIQEKR